MNVLMLRTVKDTLTIVLAVVMFKSLGPAQWMATSVLCLFGLTEHTLLSFRPRDLDEDVPCVTVSAAG